MSGNVTTTAFELPARAAAWPADLRAMAGLLRVALGTAGPETILPWPAQLDPDAFLAAVMRQRVGAFLHQRLPAEIRRRLPPTIQTQLESTARRTAQLALVRSAELVRLAGLFRAAGVPFISVKGPLLAQALYGGVGVRHAGDLDLLIHPDRLTVADEALRRAGYRRSLPDFELTPRQWHEFQRLKHEFEYFNDVTQVRIEVEWRLEGLAGQPFADWLARGRRETLGGEEIVRLPTETEFFYLFVHGAGHGWFRLFWLVDVALLLMREGVDWAALIRAARASRVEAHVWQGARLAEMLLQIPLPDALRVPVSQAVRVDWLTNEALGAMSASETGRKGLPELFRQTRYQLHLRQGWPAKAAVLRPRLMSPANWKMLRLSDRWFALYYLAAPFLWLIRRLDPNR